MVKKVINYIKENRILNIKDSVLLGVSGGADSVSMLCILKELEKDFELNLTVVHVNHHIRGKEAKRDQDFVEELCKKMNVNFLVVDVNIPKIVEETGLTEEEAGRNERYKAFYNIAKEQNCNKIAVAHNLNDNSETILFNLFRGTGIKGLTGIMPKRDMIIRPLLCCTRNDIVKYLKEKNVDFITDSTNELTEYTRNKIRLELIPYITKNINNNAEENIVSAANNLREINDFLDGEVNKAYNLYVNSNVFLEKGFMLHPAIKKGIIRKIIEKQAGRLKDITKIHINDVLELENMNVSKQVSLPYNLIGKRTYDGIIITKNVNNDMKKKEPQNLIFNGKIFETKNFHIKLENSGFNIENIQDLRCTKWFDYDKIHSLTLRNRQEKDYIVINDFGDKKKLKDYFINEKIPKEERDNIWVLADDNHVVWVVGYRISSYYKVTDKTQNIVKISYTD